MDTNKFSLRIPDWDFAWQEQYSLKERLRLPKGTRLESELSYDNSAANRAIRLRRRCA